MGEQTTTNGIGEANATNKPGKEILGKSGGTDQCKQKKYG
jgi:hypothetical protein